jgi:hypothetical protein
MNADTQKQENLSGEPAYPPSWYDKFSGWVNRLPGPSWVAYLVFVLLLTGGGAIIQLLDDPSQPVVFPSAIILEFFQIAYILSLVDFLDKRAESALEVFRSILNGDEAQYLGLKTRLTTLPARPVAIVTLSVLVFFTIFGIWFFSSPSSDATLVSATTWIYPKTPSGGYFFLIDTLLWVFNGVFIYHTIHQLKTIDYAYTQCAEINLFRQTELYAFSTVSASTAIGLSLSSPVWMIIDPGLFSTTVSILFAILAIIIFVTPIVGVHNLLKDQKDALTKNISLKAEALILDLLSRIEDQNLIDIETYEGTLSSLEKADSRIEGISTWPWKTETVRQFIAALFLPVSIWMIQFYLNQLLTN